MKDFKLLIENISVVHNQLQQQAANAVNQSLTIRNWLIGHYIVEYEQNGKDRAEYGTKLLSKIAVELNSIKGIDERALQRYRIFYKLYQQIGLVLIDSSISGSVIPILEAKQISGSLTPLLL